MIRVAIFDDMLAARSEIFQIPGLDITVYPDADHAAVICAGDEAPAVVFMDFAMGPTHLDGAVAIEAIRGIGYTGRIVATSSDPAMNTRMIASGANEALAQKAMLRSFLVALGKGMGRTTGPMKTVPPQE